ncbi:GroES-like protein [Venturia nashicola]|uniref:GroES-like protein n=1 Tax=Venturia nashicola TaxID=86259 RepID=A0A4Z1NHU7_9PEZI|nr:GroES-like protein [Venturia nashicola]TLD19539.1 GroES-like protein [Venturia nashicola]
MSLVSALPSTITVPNKQKRTHWGNSINGLRSPSPEPRAAKRVRIAAAGLRTPESEVDEEIKSEFQKEVVGDDETVPETQKVLLLRAVKTKYEIVEGYSIPEIESSNEDELVVKVLFVGLNPIDWKSPDFGFGIPVLPFLSGRDIVGTVIKAPANPSSRVKKGDVILTASTDYRDLRKAAYQSYAVAPSYNVCRVPVSTPRDSIAGLGVAFIAAILGLGVCLGIDFSKVEKGPAGPNIRKMLQGLNEESIPKDVREESLRSITDAERPKSGDWILIWGGSTSTAKLAAQLSKLAGLRVIKAVDVAKHGEQLSTSSADLLVDSHDPDRAIQIIKRVTKNRLRIAIDTIGNTTADLCQRCLEQGIEGEGLRAHLVALSGLPKVKGNGVVHHNVPIKVHHAVKEVGEGIMVWLEKLLGDGLIRAPEAEIAPGGLEGVNDALDRMRRGEVSGKRLIVELS